MSSNLLKKNPKQNETKGKLPTKPRPNQNDAVTHMLRATNHCSTPMSVVVCCHKKCVCMCLFPQEGVMARAFVLELPAAGAAAGGARRRRRLLLLQWGRGRLAASSPAQDGDAAVAVGSLGGCSVHRALQTTNTARPSPGHLPDHRRLRQSNSPISYWDLTWDTPLPLS